MICDHCGKQQATVHLTEIINSKMSELHLCESCAREKGAAMKQHFSLADLLAGLSELGTAGTDFATDLVCKDCGLSYGDFKKIGRLGCGRCYEAFREGLVPLLKRIHGAAHHVGRVPRPRAKSTGSGQQIQELSKRLERAIELEEFEEAARVRDEIRRLEKSAQQKSSKKAREKSK